MSKIIVLTEDAYKEIIDRLCELDIKVSSIGRSPPEQHNQSEWLSSDEVVELLSISTRTLQNYRDRSVLGFSKIGRKIFYQRAEINRLLQENYYKI